MTDYEDSMVTVVIGGVVGVVAYRKGWLDMFFGKKDAMNADFITSGAPPAAMIRRNEGPFPKL